MIRWVLIFIVLLGGFYFLYRNQENFGPVIVHNPVGKPIELTGESMDLIKGYIAPYYLNSEKLQCDIYPRANGSIYQYDGNLLTGFPFYDKAY